VKASGKAPAMETGLIRFHLVWEQKTSFYAHTFQDEVYGIWPALPDGFCKIATRKRPGKHGQPSFNCV
jgi:hypothetical protein